MADRDKRRQKKLEKHKKKRQLAAARARRQVVSLAPGYKALVRAAAAAPPGPYWVGGDYRSTAHPPPLLTVATLRKLADGRTLLATALLDRTCLGAKDGFLREVSEGEWFAMKEDLRRSHRGAFEEVDATTALSLVHHAVDYARRLGFEPHPDFPAAVFGPRPEPLADTAWANSPFPIYISGPDDDVGAVLRRLNATVGQGRYHFTPGEMGGLLEQLDELDEDDEAELVEGEGEAAAELGEGEGEAAAELGEGREGGA
ncbi:MAG TPA: hypothetical protein VFS43_06310 [Polyangiaceae bacterium]|nr:hypothetical protein [Polyangiaceae bacterium]